MDDFKEGLVQAIVGVVGAIVFTSILSALKQDESLPAKYFWIFTIIGLASSIGTIFVFRTTGWFFNAGWIIGAWLLKDAMDTGMFLTFFIAPIIIMIIRLVLLFKGYFTD